jgi:sn-glycerol 3-phosphate transport system permease protein
MSGTTTRLREYGTALAFLVPSLVIFVLFIFWPLVRSVKLSFYGSDIFGRPTLYVGLRNFSDVLTSPAFGKVLLITFGYVLLTVIPGLLIALALAVLLANRLAGMKFFRTAFAMPFAYSVATASVVFGSTLFNSAIGVLNYLLDLVGISPVNWLTSPFWALVSVAAVTVWMAVGYNLLVLSAGLGGIPDEIYEAARLDGARGLRLVRSITLPLLTPSLFFLGVVSTIQSLQSFAQIRLLTDGGPDGATTTLVYAIYQNAFDHNNSRYGLASAQAIVLLVIVLAITALQFGILERKVFYR